MSKRYIPLLLAKIPLILQSFKKTLKNFKIIELTL